MTIRHAVKYLFAVLFVALCTSAPIIAQNLLTLPNWTNATRVGVSPGAVGFNTQTNLPEYLDNNAVWHSFPASPPMSISVGTTAVGNGTNGFCLTDAAGVLGNIACGGTGTLTVGTTPITGGTTGNCLTVGFGVLGVASCGSGGGVVSVNDNGGGTLTIAPTTASVVLGCTTATVGQIGCAKPDGSTIGVVAGVLSVINSMPPNFSITGGCGNTATAGAITALNPAGAIASQLVPNPQTGSNYAIAVSDCGNVVALSSASNQVPTIPQAGSTGFTAGYYTTVCNYGAGTQTLTPLSGTIAGLSSFLLVASSATKPTCIGLYSGGLGGVNDYGVITGSPPSLFTTVTTQAGTTYTFASSDCGTEVVFTNGSAITATIPAALTTGCKITVLQAGAGKVSVNGTAVSAATLHTHVASSAATGTGGQYAEIQLDIYTTGVAILTGDGA